MHAAVLATMECGLVSAEAALGGDGFLPCAGAGAHVHTCRACARAPACALEEARANEACL